MSLCRVHVSLTPTARSYWLMKLASQVNIQDKVSPPLLVWGTGASYTDTSASCTVCQVEYITALFLLRIQPAHAGTRLGLWASTSVVGRAVHVVKVPAGQTERRGHCIILACCGSHHGPCLNTFLRALLQRGALLAGCCPTRLASTGHAALGLKMAFALPPQPSKLLPRLAGTRQVVMLDGWEPSSPQVRGSMGAQGWTVWPHAPAAHCLPPTCCAAAS